MKKLEKIIQWSQEIKELEYEIEGISEEIERVQKQLSQMQNLIKIKSLKKRIKTRLIKELIGDDAI